MRRPCSDAVAIEVLGRQLANRGGPDALLSLCPWLEFITIPTQVGVRREGGSRNGPWPSPYLLPALAVQFVRGILGPSTRVSMKPHARRALRPSKRMGKIRIRSQLQPHSYVCMPRGCSGRASGPRRCSPPCTTSQRSRPSGRLTRQVRMRQGTPLLLDRLLPKGCQSCHAHAHLHAMALFCLSSCSGCGQRWQPTASTWCRP